MWEGVCWQAGAGSGLGWGGRETDVHLATPACPARLSRYRPRHTAAEFLTVTTCDHHSPPTKIQTNQFSPLMAVDTPLFSVRVCLLHLHLTGLRLSLVCV